MKLQYKAKTSDGMYSGVTDFKPEKKLIHYTYFFNGSNFLRLENQESYMLRACFSLYTFKNVGLSTYGDSRPRNDKSANLQHFISFYYLLYYNYIVLVTLNI